MRVSSIGWDLNHQVALSLLVGHAGSKTTVRVASDIRAVSFQSK